MKIKMESAIISRTAAETVAREMVQLVTEGAGEKEIEETGAEEDKAGAPEWVRAEAREEQEAEILLTKIKMESAISVKSNHHNKF